MPTEYDSTNWQPIHGLFCSFVLIIWYAAN